MMILKDGDAAATPSAGAQAKSDAVRTYRIASIPADGIGPEVIAAGLQALEALARRDGGFAFDVTAHGARVRHRACGALG